MNRFITNIFCLLAAAIGAVVLTGCADDAIVNEPVDGGKHVYTLQVTAEDPAASRVASEYDVAKVVWRYGDQLILSTTVENETTEYTFTLTPPQGSSYAVGDDWQPSAGAEHPRFSYSSTEAIPSFNSFTGKLKYKSVNSSVNKKIIYSKTSEADGSGKAVQMVGYHFDASSEAADGGVPEVYLDHFDLYMAMPVRPMFYEDIISIKETLKTLLID